MRIFRSAIFISSVLISLAALAQPNIVFILTDDVGTGWIPPYAEKLTVADIEPEIVGQYQQTHGHQGAVDLEAHLAAAKVSMPTLSKLSKQSAVFHRAFATASLCSPSRAGLLTGSFQQTWGAYWNKDVDDHGIPADHTLLSESLHKAGYRCGIVGKWHVAKQDPRIMEKAWVEELGEELPIPKYYGGKWPQLQKAMRANAWKTSSAPGQHPLDRGFDYYFGYNSYDDQDYGSETLWEGWARVPKRPEGEFLTDLFNRKAVEFIESSLDRKKPFFLYYAPKTLHGGIKRPPESYVQNFDTGNRFSDLFAGHLLALDDGIGKILQTLETRKQLENTLIIFTSDNGFTLYNVPPYNAPNRGGKGSGWLGGLNVPLIIWNPKLIRPGEYNDIVSLADLMPTILNFVGMDPPSGIDGISLFPYLIGASDRPPRKSLGAAGIHSSRWSYSYETHGENNTKDAMEAPMYAWVLEEDMLLMQITETPPGLYENLPEGLPGRTLLFDIESDRAQRENLAEAFPEKIPLLQSRVSEWLQHTAEPLTSQQDAYEHLQQPDTP